MSPSSTAQHDSAAAPVERSGGAPQKTEPRFVGDISPKQREAILGFSNHILRGPATWAKDFGARLEMTEVVVEARAEDGKSHMRMVFEAEMGPDMCNVTGIMHGGCSMYIIDVCSSIALVGLGRATNKPADYVSQAITTTFHAPAPVGSKLKIINYTVSFGRRTVAARTEIWDVTHRRLIATGIHNQMAPSAVKL
ncbi:HotDog domain-containing protein [Trametes maxima]|nr:HotDog domain-containing protein [Trametes maxima]